VRLSISMANHSWPGGAEAIGPRVSRLVRHVDQTGIDTLWAMDHMFQIEINGPATEPLLEAYALLGFVAGQTERVRIGALVTAVSYRPPGLLLKHLTSLDVLTGGRVWLGIGAAWHDEEARAFGLPFPSLAERYERLEETLQIAHHIWSGDAGPFEGSHYRLENPFTNPNTVQRPHPPILIGGSGERKTLRLVARYADACNLFDVPEGVEIAGIVGGKDGLRRKLDVLRGHCEDVGRPYGEIEKTVVTSLDLGPGGMSPAQVVDHLGGLAGVGLEHAIVEGKRPWDDDTLEVIAGIVPEVERLP
jgi:F420-dependent oxidoreductase-like protein